MKKLKYFNLFIVLFVLLGFSLSCQKPEKGEKGEEQAEKLEGVSGDIQQIAQDRNLSPDDVEAALKTYVPTGKYDDYLMMASGGHSGQVMVIGIPSMRLLRVISVFTPEPWQGYGYGSVESATLLKEGEMPVGENKTLSWGDTHHPALSETNGDYDGKFLFINDKANARVAVIDLRDFETKQIVKTANLITDHGATFVTPNSEYVIEGSQYAAPIPFDKYSPIENYKKDYRGLIVFHKFDRDSGKINEDESFQIVLPPYAQDLCDAGKKESNGWVFCNSFNTEMAVGGDLEGQPPLEAGASQNDMDFMHVINWKKAEQVVNDGKYQVINGARVIPLQTAIDEHILYFIPEPKSPHGVDVAPHGNYIVISGKLDTHTTIYSFDKIQKAIDNGDFSGKDDYGVPILNYDSVKEAQVEVGLGPLHTQFDNKGNAYTSLFIESNLAKWKLGPPYNTGDDAWTLTEKIPVHYNIGHLACAEGDTVNPDGKYCVALNKWAIDRFTPTGPLEPQNFQLIDVSGKKMQRLYDMPIGLGEPHYAQIIKTDKLNPWLVYPEVGFDPLKMAKDPDSAQPGKEAIKRNGNKVEVWMTAIRSHFTPDQIKVKQGDEVILHITNIERARDATHGFAIDGYNVNLSLEPGESNLVKFKADKPGVYPFYCTEFCSALHLEMAGYLFVEPTQVSERTQ